MHTNRDERSLGELFSELTEGISTLVRQEIALASTEMSHKASRVGEQVAYLVAGGAVAYAGFLAIVAAVIAILDLFLPLWLSALIVGAVVALVGYLLVQRGLSALKNLDLAPRQTIETLQEAGELVKEQTR
jgi:hypothetical protein